MAPRICGWGPRPALPRAHRPGINSVSNPRKSHAQHLRPDRTPPRPAVFLDRDGVINEDRTDYVKSWEEFRFIRGVRGALGRLRETGLPVVVITNQSAVNRGLIHPEILEAIHRKMIWGIEKAGGALAGIYFCPHRPDESCDCRKPRDGLLRRAVRELNLDPSRSVFIGDTRKDLAAGESVGCRTVLVLTGQGRKTLGELLGAKSSLKNLTVCSDLPAALALVRVMLAGAVLRTEQKGPGKNPGPSMRTCCSRG